jgi:hypothetical protein
LAGLGIRLPVLNTSEGQANLPILAHIGVVNLGCELEHGGFEWIVLGEVDTQTEGLEVIGRLVL